VPALRGRLVRLLFYLGALTAISAGSVPAQTQQPAAAPPAKAESPSGPQQPLNLMVVDTQALMRKSKAAVTARQQIEQKRDEYLKEISQQEEGLRQQPDAMQRDQALKDLGRDLANKRQALEKALSDAEQNIHQAIDKILTEIAKDRDAVLVAKDGLLVYKEALSVPDVTQEVLEKLDSRLPTIAINVPQTAPEPRADSGEDINDLLARHKVDARVVGSGIERVSVRLRRTRPEVAAVMIPVGTYFVAANSASQNMISTEAYSTQLADDDWVVATVPAACANKPLNVPGEKDSFSIRRAPEQAELATAIRALHAAHASYSVVQAGVWIVTDNASYDGMGTLVRQPSGKRVIGPADAAQAMKILDSAGIAIKRRAIWQHDRHRLAGILVEQPVAEWLRSK
jgi:hypothetical protein